MKSEIRINYYHYVFGIGYPIVISQIFEASEKNHLAEIYIIEGNYNNKESKIAVRKFVSVNKLLQGVNNDTELALDFVLQIVLTEYQVNLSENNDELLNKSIPLKEFESKPLFNKNSIALLEKADDIIWEIQNGTSSDELREYIKSITPIKLDFKINKT